MQTTFVNFDTSHIVTDALRSDDAETLLSCIHFGFNPEQQDSQGNFALLIAAESDSIECLRALIAAGVLLDQRNCLGKTALMAASFRGSYHSVTELIAAQANLDLQESSHGYNALMLAILYDNIESARLLIAAGTELSQITYQGNTALMLAAERGMIQIVQDLIRRNLSGIINHQNLLGESALLIAVKFQHISCIKALFNAGAATNLQNYCNETALSLAIQSANPLIIELFQPQYPEAPEEIFFCYQPEDIQNFDNAAASSASVSQAYTENKEQQESLNEDSFNEDYINFLIDSVLGKQYLDSSDELPSKRRKKNPIAYEVFLETTLGKTGLSEEERASRKRLKGSGY